MFHVIEFLSATAEVPMWMIALLGVFAFSNAAISALKRVLNNYQKFRE